MEQTQAIKFVLLGLIIIAFFSVGEFIFLKKRSVPETPVIKKYSYIPQFVVLSFDGSKDINMWESTRAFARDMQASSTPVHFTYFVNAVYFLTKDKSDHYQGPRHALGETPIGFSEDLDHVRQRINEVNAAITEGHEIGSHAVGHFMGGEWTVAEWKQEFKSFSHILFEADEHYPDAHLPKLKISEKDIIGFRAPGLSINDSAYQALSDNHFRYDASGIARGDAWPRKDDRGIWHYPLGTIFLGSSHHLVLAMDYNIWTHQMDGMTHVTIKKGTPQWKKDFDDVVSGYTEYFNKNYSGDRAPVIIGHHFSGWNDNMYWEAMQAFAKDVCGKPQVECVNFRELTKYMDEYGAPVFVKK